MLNKNKVLSHSCHLNGAFAVILSYTKLYSSFKHTHNLDSISQHRKESPLIDALWSTLIYWRVCITISQLKCPHTLLHNFTILGQTQISNCWLHPIMSSVNHPSFHPPYHPLYPFRPPQQYGWKTHENIVHYIRYIIIFHYIIPNIPLHLQYIYIDIYVYILWQFNIAIETHHFIAIAANSECPWLWGYSW